MNSSKIKEIEWRKVSEVYWQVTLNRPEKYNAFTLPMYEQLTEILEEGAKDEHLVLLALTGKGLFFSSGADLTGPLKILENTELDLDSSLDAGQSVLRRFIDGLIDFPKLLIGLINGPSIGIGVTILGLFDGVFASTRSTFIVPFTRTGQSPEGCSSLIFPSLMGSLRAKDLLLFNRLLTVQQAEERGLVTRILDEQRFEEQSAKIVDEILSLPRGSLLESKALIQRANLERLHRVNDEELKTLKGRWTSDEFLQAILNFTNKKNRSKL